MSHHPTVNDICGQTVICYDQDSLLETFLLSCGCHHIIKKHQRSPLQINGLIGLHGANFNENPSLSKKGQPVIGIENF